MFSFLKKKTSPTTPPSEEQDIIPGSIWFLNKNINDNYFFNFFFIGPDSSLNNGDGFVVINHENPSPVNNNLYPPIPPIPVNNMSYNKIPSIQPAHYLQGVPFKISPEIENSKSFETYQLEIDGILALMTKRLQFEEDYDFSLEREIISQQNV